MTKIDEIRKILLSEESHRTQCELIFELIDAPVAAEEQSKPTVTEPCPLSHAVQVKEVEPLEELAERNGISAYSMDGSLAVYRKGGNCLAVFHSPACESQARKWLEELEDKGEGI
jgi:hypothetical protein